MNEVSKGGLALAKQIVPAYSDNPQVKAMMVGGSVSRGCADSYSDLEIGVFWTTPPSPEERKAAIERLGGEVWSFDRSRGTEHYGLAEVTIEGKTYRGTAMISTQHLTVGEVEACLLAVLDHYETASGKQVLLAAVQNGVPLHGPELLHTWQAKIAGYPKALAIKVIQENLWFGPWFCPEAYAERDDILVLYQHFIWMEQRLLKLLAGLNRLYYPSPEHKWLDELATNMKLAPPNLAPRLEQVFRVEPLEGWHQLKALIDETIALVELHLPEVNTVPFFKDHPEVNTTWAKKRWAKHPPYSLMKDIGASRAKLIG